MFFPCEYADVISAMVLFEVTVSTPPLSVMVNVTVKSSAPPPPPPPTADALILYVLFPDEMIR